MSCCKFSNNYPENRLHNKEHQLSYNHSSNYYTDWYRVDSYICHLEQCNFIDILSIYQVRYIKCSFILHMEYIIFSLGIKLSGMDTDICYWLLQMFMGKNRHCLLIKWNLIHKFYIYWLQNIKYIDLWCIIHKVIHLMPFYLMGMRINLLQFEYKYHQGRNIYHQK